MTNWPFADGETVAMTPHTRRQHNPYSTNGVGGTYSQPLYTGSRTVRYTSHSSNESTDANGCNVFNDSYSASTAQSIVYASIDDRKPRRNPADFTAAMEPRPSNLVSGDQSPGFGLTDGAVVAGAQPREPPGTTICGDATDATFTREEVPL